MIRPALIGCALIATLRAGAQQALPAVNVFLGKTIGLSAQQLAAVEHSEAVVHVLPTSDRRDVAVFGIVAVSVPRAFFAGSLTRFPESLKTPGRTGLGVFGSPASAADVEGLEVPATDLAALRKCHTGSCESKRSSSDMVRLRAILDSPGVASLSRAVAYERRRVVSTVNAYREHGNSALPVYDDFGAGGVRGGDAFTALIAETPYIFQYAPSFRQYLLDYPRERIKGASELFYWARDELPGTRSTLSVNHLTVYSPGERPVLTIAGTKQLLADHYFEAALDLLIALDRPTSSGQGIYVMVVREYRFDHFPPSGPMNLRSKVVGRLRDRVEADLRRIRTEAEAAAAGQPGVLR